VKVLFRATSCPFVKDPEQLLLLARVAETWRCRPSELLGLTASQRNQTPALQMDLACAVALWQSRSAAVPVPGAHEEWW
jgi:hypothetical protein